MRAICVLLLVVPFSCKEQNVDLNNSNLPIVIITTDGGKTVDGSQRLPGTMKIINRGAGKINFLTDANDAAFLQYDGRIGIKVRGFTSQYSPKKSYAIHTMRANDKKQKKVSLLGMSEQSDWILNNLTYDPSMMHDFLAYHFARSMGNYASKTSYCEVILNGNYKGLYLLEQKISRESIGIAKLKPEDSVGVALTGGYFVEIDRSHSGESPAWTMNSYNSELQEFYYIKPKASEISPVQADYIKSVFSNLERNAKNPNVLTGYPSIIDVPSFIDYMLVGEVAANCDVYTYSTKFHKDRGGKLRAGPVWDFNLGFGTDMYFDGAIPGRSAVDQWQFDNGDNEGPKFFKDLYNVPEFRGQMAKRLQALSKPGQTFNVVLMHHLIDSTASTIAAATARDCARWGIDLPYFKRKTFMEEVVYLKSFLSKRVAWMAKTLGVTS